MQGLDSSSRNLVKSSSVYRCMLDVCVGDWLLVKDMETNVCKAVAIALQPRVLNSCSMGWSDEYNAVFRLLFGCTTLSLGISL